MLAPALALSIAAATPLFSPASGPIEIEADVLTATVGARVYEARGDVVITRPGATLHADRVVFDEARGVAIAEGRAVLVEGATVLTCDRLELQVSTLTGTITRGSMRSGGAMALEAEQVVRTARRRFRVAGGSFTPCRCEPGEAPSWRIGAKEAEVDLDHGAWLTWPVLYAKDVPIFALPVFYIPLGERRTGLLTPRAGYSTTVGPWVTEPFFLTLGRSWDATLEATGYFERGPAPALELRWAPADTDQGQVRGTYFADLAKDLHRFAVAGRHRSALEQGRFAVDLNVVSDALYVAEIADRFLERKTEETVSRATWSRTSSAGARVAVGTALRQDLRGVDYTPLLSDRRFDDRQGPGDVRVRFLELRADATPLPLYGPLTGELRLSAHAFAAPHPMRERFIRADVRPALSLPIDLFGLGTLTPAAAVRLGGWRGADNTGVRFAGVFATSLSTELSRRYGRFVHVIRPELRHVIIPAVAGELAPSLIAGDEIDGLARTHQLAGRIDSELWSAEKGTRVARVGAIFGGELPLPDQPAEVVGELLVHADLALTFGEADAGRFGLEGLGAFDVEEGLVKEATLRADFGWTAALGLSAAIGRFGEAPIYSRAGAEELIPGRALLGLHQLASSPGTVLDAGVRSRPIAPIELSLGTTVDLEAPAALEDRVRQVYGGARWDSPCACWSASLTVVRTREAAPGLGPAWNASFLLDLTGLGSAGASTALAATR